MNRFLSLATATGGLLGLALSLLGAAALRIIGVSGNTPALVAGLVAGFGLGLLGAVWRTQDDATGDAGGGRDRRAPGRRRDEDPPSSGPRARPYFGPLAFGLTFVTLGGFMGLQAAEELSADPRWLMLAGPAWLTLAIAGGAGGIIAGAVWEVVTARLRKSGIR